MAYAATISLQRTLEQILLHPHRYYSIPCDKEHIESLHEKLGFLQRFLEEHPSTKSNEEVSSLERRIRDAAYEAEDFMDLHLSNQPNSEEMMGRIDDIELMMKKVDSIIEQVTEIKEQMGLEITQGRGSSGEEEIKIGKVRTHEDSEPRSALHEDSSQLVSSERKNLMVGFDDHLKEIKDQLTGQSSALEVISLVGMGGIGKTTLATRVYGELHCENHFDICVWVTLSQSYSVRDVLLGMLRSMKILTKEMLREGADRLRLHVYHHLINRRYLIMIDDIWDTNAWDHLKTMFRDDETRSRIMLTTRIADVAAYASPSWTTHSISLLNNDQSWTLLCAEVFGDEPCPFNLQEIGKTIAHNCQGLPLSIAIIGRLLSKVDKTQMAWQSIAENVTSFVFSSDGHCSEILRLSYNFLPQYLKACFLYMAVIPKSYEIHVSKLTQMWVAEGFLRQVDGQSSEEVAEKCVEDLLDRSLILMSKKNSDGKIKSFRIHDLLHDFCTREAKYEKFLQVTKSGVLVSPTDLISDRRISIHPGEVLEHSQFPFNSIASTSYVRSLVSAEQCSFCSSVLLRFKLLRVLDVIQVEFLEFPSQVLELLNLRYIALICNGDIPASITKLWNLQTLIIVRNWSRRRENYLPVEIWTMSHLRHVRCDEAQLLDPVAAKFDIYRKNLALEDLQTLSGLWNLVFTEELLQRIPNIKKIDVEYESLHLKKWSDYQLENLGSLHQLQSLKIGVIPCVGVLINLFKPSMFKFHFPTSLKTLILSGVGIPWHDLAIIGSLPNLEVLKLVECACLGTKWETNEGEFRGLKVLVLERLKLKHWEADHDHFPCLQRLVIRWCYGLVKIPYEMGDSSTLTMIELRGCQDTVFDSAKEILEKQRGYGNDFQVIVDDKKRIHKLSHAIEEFLGLPSIFG